MATSPNLEDMKLPELRDLAKQMGLRGTSTMRKPELVATLQAARTGGEAPEGVTVKVPKPAVKTVNIAQIADDAKASKDDVQTTDTRNAYVASHDDESVDEKMVQTKRHAGRGASVDADAVDIQLPALPSREDRRGRRNADAQDDDMPRVDRRARKRRGADDASSLLDGLDLDISQPKREDRRNRRNRDDDFNADQTRCRRRGSDLSGITIERDTDRDLAHEDDSVRDLADILATLPNQPADNARHDRVEDEESGEDREFSRRSRNRHTDHEDRRERMERRGRRMRGRDDDRDATHDAHDSRDDRERDRDARDMRSERSERLDHGERETRREEPQDDLVPVAGIVDVLDSYAFVRTSGYLPGPNDVYVSMGQVKKYGLRKGDAVHGSIRAPRDGERRNQRQKFVPLQSIDSINGMTVEEAANRPQFNKLTPLYPQERLKQETTPNKLTGRLIDIVAPIGKGQRGLIVSPPKAGKTITLQNIANAIATNNPEVHLMVVLVDERPEEVTDMERTVQGEVISSTFDRPASDHTTVAELAIERAKRLVELGQDVVVLLDSMTRLARAYNIAAPASGRILSGGVDAQALYPPKKFFGAARNIENGGSLTIISSALVETGSKMDEVIFEEFKGTGNMELRLSRELADKRLFPAIDVNASGTRREELITDPQELPIIYRLRRLLGGLEPEQAYQTLVPRLKKTPTNRDFMAAIVQQANANGTNGN